MATTLQKPPNPSQMDPRLRRAVYAKYREMLVSKNNQANEMIKKLPAYMVREDRGFHKNIIANDVPPPPPIPGSNIPAQRLQTQISEAPACVQNAMMTKDKKPFTYTPGGIDLSQIKSPRMAKRISANANSPGVTNTPKVSPLAQISNNGSSSPLPMNQSPQTPQSAGIPPPPPPPMGSLAMGMPFQVFPTGPPPPTKAQQQNKNMANGTVTKKPTQSFEPPPMGCRPEIKIPENPMAALKKVPKPQQRDDYWIQEYVAEKARNSAPNEEEIRQYISSPTIQQYQQQTREFTPPKPPSPITQNILPAKQSTQQTSVPQYMQRRSPSPPELQKDKVNVSVRNLKLEENRTASPTRVQISQSPIAQQQSSSSPVNVVKNVVFEPIQQNNNTHMNMQPQQSYQQPMQNYQQQQPHGKIILSTMPKRNQQQQQATQHLGSLYIPPPNLDDKQYLLSQQSPQWMSSKQSLDTPEWVNRDEIDNLLQQSRSMNMMQQPSLFSPKEHVIPISFEKSPTTPNFGPTPFYGTPQHHINSVISPKVDPNANKFVNQGYNNIEFPQAPQQPMRPYVQAQKQQQPATGTRIIPIQVEGARAPQPNENTIVMQSDPRSPSSPRINIGPTQSRSFKILQQVTGTMGDESDENSNESKPKNKSDEDEPMQEQLPIFSRPLGPNDMNESQLKRLQMSESDKAFMSRVKSQAPAGRQPQKMPQDELIDNQAREPGLYQGSAIPSRSFKILQAMTQPENADDNSNENSDIEGNSYTSIGNDFYNNYHSCNHNSSNPLNCQNCQINHPNINYHCTVPQTPQMYPQFMMPPQYAALYDWYDPQNNPWAAYYYQHAYDSNYFGQMPPQPSPLIPMPSHSRSQTPQPQSHMSQNQPPPPPMPYFYPAYPPPFFIMPPFMGFRPISASRETTPCFSEAERYQNISAASDERSRRAVSCTPTCCQHAKSFQVENLSNKFHTFEEPLLRPVSVQNESTVDGLSKYPTELSLDNIHVECPSDDQPPNYLKSIPSFSNVNALNDDCDLEELKAKPIITACDEHEDDVSESEDTTEVEEEISQDTETVEVHFPHQLSIIYEENESFAGNERRSSICSRSSTLSDCSTTLMEEDNISIDEHSGGELEDDTSSSVTVRLPLKFSFTRSKDNMVNTTLTVGESESEIHEKPQEKSSSPIGSTHLNSLSNNSSANDVSVTVSLKSKSKSKTPERLIPPTLGTLSTVKCDSVDESDENECSVSISLPKLKSKSIEIDENRKRLRKDSENSEHSHSILSENSAENKVHIDNSLYTSLDALEEIKKGMNEITNSLFSKICTLRKSAINIPEQDGNRSSSVSYIDSIESDDENEEILGEYEDENEILDENSKNISKDVLSNIPELKASTEIIENFSDHQYKYSDKQLEEVESYEPKIIELEPCDNKIIDQSTKDQEENEEVDFWSEIKTKNQDTDHNLSKTSTHSSRYWFEVETDDGLEPAQDDGLAKYETHDVTTSISFVSINDAATVENDEMENDDFDYWKDYDSDGDYGMKASKFFKSQIKDENETLENYCNDANDGTKVSIYEDPIFTNTQKCDSTEIVENLKEPQENNDGSLIECEETIETTANHEQEQNQTESSNECTELALKTTETSLKDAENNEHQKLIVNDQNLKRPLTPHHRKWETKSEIDDDSDTESCKAFVENNQNVHSEVTLENPITQKSTIQVFNDDLDSDEEWTEEEIEVTEEEEESDDALELDEMQQIKLKKIITSGIKEAPKTEMNSDAEEEEDKDDSESEECDKEIIITEGNITTLVSKSPTILKQIDENVPSDSDTESESSDENETNNLNIHSATQSPHTIINSPNSISNSSSRIIKGKSLVNVNSFIHSGNDKIARDELKSKIDNECKQESSESSDSSEEEENEVEDVNESLQIICNSSNSNNDVILHSNDDCHDILTPITQDNNKVLLSNMKEIHSVDSKSNMTSESGISFENEYDDSDDENIENEQIKKTLQEPIIPQSCSFDNERPSNDANEIKVNVKGKISMFERAMSEEKTIDRKDIPKVSAKYSFRHREMSEPPSQHPLPHRNSNILNHNERATSELKETASKNQKLIDLINQRQSLPPTPTTNENYENKSVKEKISSFESGVAAKESDANEKRENYRRYGYSKANLSPLVRSIEESDKDDDSGVTSDFCKQQSENETDSENFPELRKLSRYERASTHSRLYKLLQGDESITEHVDSQEESPKESIGKIPYKSKKIIHNVSVTRRQNPQAAMQAETMEERRQRLCLPLTHQSSSGIESMSSSTTPSPTPVNEKLVNELVQSLLSQKRGRIFRDLPIEKLHAAAVKILHEDLESTATFSSADESTVPTVDSTPALTPQEFRNNSSYTEYYDSWQPRDLNIGGSSFEDFGGDLPLIQSKAFRNLQDQQSNSNKKLWSARCPRILSSKSINKDLARLSEVRESESPEPNHSRSPSIRSMSTEPMSGENRITNNIHQNHQERQKAAANT